MNTPRMKKAAGTSNTNGPVPPEVKPARAIVTIDSVARQRPWPPLLSGRFQQCIDLLGRQRSRLTSPQH